MAREHHGPRIPDVATGCRIQHQASGIRHPTPRTPHAAQPARRAPLSGPCPHVPHDSPGPGRRTPRTRTHIRCHPPRTPGSRFAPPDAIPHPTSDTDTTRLHIQRRHTPPLSVMHLSRRGHGASRARAATVHASRPRPCALTCVPHKPCPGPSPLATRHVSAWRNLGAFGGAAATVDPANSDQAVQRSGRAPNCTATYVLRSACNLASRNPALSRSLVPRAVEASWASRAAFQSMFHVKRRARQVAQTVRLQACMGEATLATHTRTPRAVSTLGPGLLTEFGCVRRRIEPWQAIASLVPRHCLERMPPRPSFHAGKGSSDDAADCSKDDPFRRPPPAGSPVLFVDCVVMTSQGFGVLHSHLRTTWCHSVRATTDALDIDRRCTPMEAPTRSGERA